MKKTLVISVIGDPVIGLITGLESYRTKLFISSEDRARLEEGSISSVILFSHATKAHRQTVLSELAEMFGLGGDRAFLAATMKQVLPLALEAQEFFKERKLRVGVEHLHPYCLRRAGLLQYVRLQDLNNYLHQRHLEREQAVQEEVREVTFAMNVAVLKLYCPSFALLNQFGSPFPKAG